MEGEGGSKECFVFENSLHCLESSYYVSSTVCSNQLLAFLGGLLLGFLNHDPTCFIFLFLVWLLLPWLK